LFVIRAFAISLLLTAQIHAQKELVITDQNEGAIEVLGEYSQIETLAIRCSGNLREVPSDIGKLIRLKSLIIENANCPINPVLPDSLGNLANLETLILDSAQNPNGPNVWSHQRRAFPSTFSSLKKLRELDLSRNGLDQIPDFVKDLPRLEEFSFQSNKNLRELPAFMASLHELTTLRLDGNDLADLPDSLSALPNLKFITLGDNCRISGSESKMNELRKRFPHIKFEFGNEFSCPSK
jgi:Leucine-rich repeat (LRR) protein